MDTNTRKREDRFNIVKFGGTTVHAAAVRRASAHSAYQVTYCNGRAVDFMVATSDDVTCRACQKRIRAEGGSFGVNDR